MTSDDQTEDKFYTIVRASDPYTGVALTDPEAIVNGETTSPPGALDPAGWTNVAKRLPVAPAINLEDYEGAQVYLTLYKVPRYT